MCRVHVYIVCMEGNTVGSGQFLGALDNLPLFWVESDTE